MNTRELVSLLSSRLNNLEWDQLRELTKTPEGCEEMSIAVEDESNVRSKRQKEPS